MVTYCILFLMPDGEFEDFNPIHKFGKINFLLSGGKVAIPYKMVRYFIIE